MRDGLKTYYYRIISSQAPEKHKSMEKVQSIGIEVAGQ